VSETPVPARPESAPAPAEEELMDLRRAMREPLEGVRRLKLGVWGGLLGLGYVGFEVATGDARWKLLGRRAWR
jgi:hypothetical protein